MKTSILKPKPKNSGERPVVKKDKGGMGTSPVTNLAKRAIPAPAQEASKQVHLQDGTEVTLRFIHSGDQRMIKEMFAGLSKESIYYRYFGYVPDITSEFLARFTLVNPIREITLVAEMKIEGVRQIIGVATLVKDADATKAEFAILITDAWQRKGLGSQLTDFAMQLGKEQGIQVLYAHFMAMNRSIDGLLRQKGFRIQFDYSGAYYAELEVA